MCFSWFWDFRILSFERFTLKHFMSMVWCPANRREDIAASPRTSIWTCFSGGCRARLRFRSLDACHVFIVGCLHRISFVMISVEETVPRTLVSMLSSEGVWFRPSRQNAEQWEEAQAIQDLPSWSQGNTHSRPAENLATQYLVAQIRDKI